jgi:ribosomal protein L3 glutamine methyltransferase
MKLLTLVEEAAARLTQAGVAFGPGTDNAFDEAAWLVLWKLGLALDALDEHADDDVPLELAAGVEALVEQRIRTRQPAAYLTGEAWLHGVPFYVDQRVIVPRSLIAEPIVEGTLDVWLSNETRTVLDLCTGNGSLAVLSAMAYPDVSVLGTDLSADALAVAARNVERHGLPDRIKLAQGDGFAAAPGRYDLIVCNPPYVNSQSMRALPAEFRAEPALALAGGRDGMDFIRGLIAQARSHLGPHGVLVLEVGHERQHFHDAFPRLPAVGLPTSLGDDQVLLIQAADLP